MNLKLIELLTAFFKKGLLYQENIKTCEELEYGISIFMQNIFKTFLLLLLAITLNISKYVFVFFIIYCLVSLFSFGLHVKSKIGCTAWGIINFIGGSYSAIYLNFNADIKNILIMICFALLACYAPAGTKMNPINPRYQFIFKMITLMIVGSLFVASNYLDISGFTVYSNIIVLAIIAQTINVLPITYHIFHQQWNPQYKSYWQENKRKIVIPDLKTAKQNINWSTIRIWGLLLLALVITNSELFSVRPAWHNESKKPNSLYFH